MLRIKKSVDLKELEAFGFKKVSLSWYVLEIRNNTEEEISFGVSLFAEPRCINIGYSTKGSQYGIASFTYDLDVLFDLIQAGLVEKVGGESE